MKKPPQGTTSIKNLEKDEKKTNSIAAKLIDDLSCYLHLKTDEDFQELLKSTKDKQPGIFKKLYEKYPKEIVGKAFRWAKLNCTK